MLGLKLDHKKIDKELETLRKQLCLSSENIHVLEQDQTKIDKEEILKRENERINEELK